MANIVVLGAGVSGLTTALTLIRENAGHKITIVGKHMPGDYDIEYASPWAGANFLPMASQTEPGSTSNNYERCTWPELERLARDLPEAGIHFQEAREYRRSKDHDTPTGQWFEETFRGNAWYKDLLPNFRILSPEELPPGCDGGTSFTSVCINTSLYLPWLASQCLRHGAILRRRVVTNLSEAADHHHSGRRADLVVNCTGLGSRRLGGVQDRRLYPLRGQVVVVRNELDHMTGTSGVDGDPEEATYIMNRAAGGGCILGGCMQRDQWESQPDLSLATRIMQRAVELAPQLVKPGQGVEGLSIVRHGVGLRPMREGGPRVEKEVVNGDLLVVHNYGHGGYGYQTSYGAARAAVDLVQEALRTKARL